MATSREPSPDASSAGDTIEDQVEDSRSQLGEVDNDDQSIADVNASYDTPPPSKSNRRGRGTTSTPKKGRGKKGAHIWINEGPQDATEDEESFISTKGNRKGEDSDPDQKTIGTAVGIRRQANGTVGSVYSGIKIRHIKKPDGTPLWRKEIQYEFLRIVVEDKEPVFTRISDGKKGCNFADIYIDCMAKSSKTSKLLKDRLRVDRRAAQNMAMICLLVNVGRMNTTLNFFPEMRAQLRTYHSIPVLQAYKSQQDYKSLQDAPRLKSILKGASEDTDEPRHLNAIKQNPVPRTNPVNLVFVLSQFAPKISETHFTNKVDFFDLTMRPTISSASRARAFLWLMWWYLESSFTKEDALNNPFGPGEYREDEDPTKDDVIPLLVPKLVHITAEEGDAENVDTEDEIAFADKMTQERKRIMAELANDTSLSLAESGNAGHKAVNRLKRSAHDYDDSATSDVDSRASPGIGRSPGPDGHGIMTLGGQADSLEDEWEVQELHPGKGRYKRARPTKASSRLKGSGRGSDATGRSSLKVQGTPDGADRHGRGTPQPIQSGNHPVISQFSSRKHEDSKDGVPTKARARTGYQRELEEHRNRRIEWALRRRRRDCVKQARELSQNSRWLLKSARRIGELAPTYDSEEEDQDSFGLGGLIGRRWTSEEKDEETLPLGYEEDDFGEEVETWLKIFQRTKRRLDVWSGSRDLAVYQARLQQATGRGRQKSKKRSNAHSTGRLAVTNGSTLDVSMQDTPSSMAHGGIRRSRTDDLNDEITQDLLAERSDDEVMEDEDESGSGEDSDVEMD